MHHFGEFCNKRLRPNTDLNSNPTRLTLTVPEELHTFYLDKVLLEGNMLPLRAVKKNEITSIPHSLPT
jgi:hypothetical protein